MIDIATIERLPEFDAISPEAVYACLGHGAAKLTGTFTEESISNLQAGIPFHPELLRVKSPEVSKFLSLFDLSAGGFINIVDVPLSRNSDTTSGSLMSHTDADAPTGMSLLVPINGEDALFGVSNKRFDEKTPPNYITSYGVGDGILIRQNVVDQLTDMKYFQAHHLGVANGERLLLAVDVRQPILKLHDEVAGVGV